MTVHKKFKEGVYWNSTFSPTRMFFAGGPVMAIITGMLQITLNVPIVRDCTYVAFSATLKADIKSINTIDDLEYQKTNLDKMDLRNYFKRKVENEDEGPSKKVVKSATGISSKGELQLVEDEMKKTVRPTKHQKVPESIRKEVGRHAAIFGTKSAIDKFSKKYGPKYEFRRTTVNTWKNLLKNKSDKSAVCGQIGRPNMVSDEHMRKIKDIILDTEAAGTAISRRIAIAIGNGVLKANNPKLLKEYGGSIGLTDMWARGILKSMNWVKRKGTTGKIEPSSQFLQEGKFTFQRKISQLVTFS